MVSASGVFFVRPMHQQQIDVVDAERRQAFVDRAGEIGGVQIFVRDLGAQEDVAARHAGGAHAFADGALGAVFSRGVDVAVAGLEGRGDMFGAHRAQAGRANSR